MLCDDSHWSSAQGTDRTIRLESLDKVGQDGNNSGVFHTSFERTNPLLSLKKDGYAVVAPCTVALLQSAAKTASLLEVTERNVRLAKLKHAGSRFKLPPLMIFAHADPWQLILHECLPMVRKLLKREGDDIPLELDLASLGLDIGTHPSFSRFRRGFRADLSLADGTCPKSGHPRILDWIRTLTVSVRT